MIGMNEQDQKVAKDFEEVLEKMGDYELVDILENVVARMKERGYSEHMLFRHMERAYNKYPR
jgi:hypothetical protein